MKLLKPGGVVAVGIFLLAVAAGAYLYLARNAADFAGQACSAGEVGDCYLELASPGDCYFRPGGTRRPAELAIWTWSGTCVGNLAQGEGTLAWRTPQHSGQAAGTIAEGRPRGQWVLRGAAGDVSEGPYGDGGRHGQWVVRHAGGIVEEGPYRDGSRHGQWRLRSANGSVEEGPYRDDKRHGQWVLRSAGGDVWEGPYRDGNEHGQWILRWANGDVEEGPYRDGRRHGQWIARDAGGAVLHTTDYRDGAPVAQ